VDFTPWLSESVLVRIHFVVRVGDRELPEVDLAELESRIVEETRPWTDALHEALVETCGEEAGSRLHRRYADAFSGAYQADWLARSAVADILAMEQLRAIRTWR
jgi:glutamate dehydrogenase